MTTSTLTVTDFVLARIAEDEERTRRSTMTISGGWPAPEVPNCIGRSGRGCELGGWSIHGEGCGWWDTPEHHAEMDAHSLLHVTGDDRRVLAQCAAMRKIVEMDCNDQGSFVDGFWSAQQEAERALASIWSDHPDFNPTWS